MWGLAVAILLGLTEGLIIKENVVFHKTNDISTTRTRWLASYVVDFDIFEQFLRELSTDVEQAMLVSEAITLKYNNLSEVGYKNTFLALFKEIQYLNETHSIINRDLYQYRSINSREKRSLIPFVGEAVSWLFGLVSEADLETIRSHVSTLARNQNRIIHVVEQSISVLNESRVHISENRQSIISLIAAVHGLDLRLRDITHTFTRKIVATEYFLKTYIKLDLLIGEIKTMLQGALFYLEHLKSQINFLSLGKVSPSVISPTDLRSLLLTIQSQLPPLLTLIGDPETDLWIFYRYLTSTAIFDDGKIIIILSIPTLRVDRTYEVYHPIPIPVLLPDKSYPTTPETERVGDLYRTQVTQATNLLATYDLEADGFLIDRGRNTYILMTSDELKACSNPETKWCAVNNPVYPVNLAKLCIIHLFLGNDAAIRMYCKTTVTLNPLLPLAKYMFHTTWIIASAETLRFNIVCQDNTVSVVTTRSPIDTLQIAEKCSASNKYLTLTTPYAINMPIKLVDQDISHLRTANWTADLIWEPLTAVLPNYNEIELPQGLKELKQIPLGALIDQLQDTPRVRVTRNTSLTIWMVGGWILGGLSLGLSLIYLAYRLKQNMSDKISLCLPNCICGFEKAVAQNAGASEEMPVVTYVNQRETPVVDQLSTPPTKPDESRRLYPSFYETTRL